MEREAVIVSPVRTAIGKYAGSLAPVKDYQLGAVVIKEAVKRSKIEACEIDDVYFGNLLGIPGNVAKVAAMEAGLPDQVPAVTIDRQCASGLESLSIATAMIQSGMGDVYVVGGTESMTNQPFYLEKANRAYGAKPPQFLNSMLVSPSYQDVSMGETAENVLNLYDFSREELDQFAYRSHQLAVTAIEKGEFDAQIVPVEIKTKKEDYVFLKDELPRKNTNLEIMGKLPPLFKKNGKVTAGNSCPLSDGASAMVVMSREKANRLGMKIFGIVKKVVNVGVNYKTMGLGPINAVKSLLRQTGISLDEVGLIELNEAFASQSLACIQELGLDIDKVNINGGAIALGHPLGATGSILTVKMLHAMKKRHVKYGIVTMCVGGGQGTAILLENV